MEKIIELESTDISLSLFGNYDENIYKIEKEFNVTIISREAKLKIAGNDNDVNSACKVIEAMIKLAGSGATLDEQTIRYCISLEKNGEESRITEFTGDLVALTIKGKPVRPKTLGQKSYVDAIIKNDITFGIGPAGTGKTYLAVAVAVRSLKAHEVSKIILTRPAVEAGEKLGFLPGDLNEKVDPYLRPLYDGLFDFLGADTFHKLQEKGIIEVAPLAYMRGRTLSDAFIILDEAQNTTPEQMKMFLTRIGENSKMVITGDVTQIDLPDKTRSGLIDASRILKDVEDIVIINFDANDVVRHKLVQSIVRAYENAEK